MKSKNRGLPTSSKIYFNYQEKILDFVRSGTSRFQVIFEFLLLVCMFF